MSSSEIITVVFSYLIGSVPFGYIYTLIYTGKDIRLYGSGNTGSTNVRRIAGKKISFATQISDMLKGLIPVLIIITIEYDSEIVYSDRLYMAALSTIIGHNFSVFLRFKGGKGVNTTMGASLLISPIPVIIAGLSYLFSRMMLKYVSVSSLVLSISLSLSHFLLFGVNLSMYYLTICSIMIFLTHVNNIKRLIKKSENL